MRRYLTLPLLVAALALSACGDDNDTTADESGATTEQAAPTEAPVEEAPPAEEEPAEDPVEEAPAELTEGDSGVKVSGELGEKPTIEVPDGDAPAGLIYQDIEVGDGAEAQPGMSINVQYVGALFDDGSEFDASWDRGAEPFTFTLGQGMVIPGWDQGLVGMKEGGRRVLTIPSSMAYGPSGSGPIPPDATLVFVVDLEKVTSP